MRSKNRSTHIKNTATSATGPTTTLKVLKPLEIETFGYIILIKQLYEQHINPLEPDPIDKHVNLGAVRRQVAQNLERYLNKSKEIKSFL